MIFSGSGHRSPKTLASSLLEQKCGGPNRFGWLVDLLRPLARRSLSLGAASRFIFDLQQIVGFWPATLAVAFSFQTSGGCWEFWSCCCEGAVPTCERATWDARRIEFCRFNLDKSRPWVGAVFSRKAKQKSVVYQWLPVATDRKMPLDWIGDGNWLLGSSRHRIASQSDGWKVIRSSWRLLCWWLDVEARFATQSCKQRLKEWSSRNRQRAQKRDCFELWTTDCLLFHFFRIWPTPPSTEMLSFFNRCSTNIVGCKLILISSILFFCSFCFFFFFSIVGSCKHVAD